MEEFKQNGVTNIFVSHSLVQIQSFCNRAIYINHSNLIAQGSTETVCKKYLDDQSAT